jgi:hypothetical protein
MLLMMSCASNLKIEYVHEVPDIPAFPIFPQPNCVTFDEESETVSMPLWYWEAIARYKIDVDAIRNYLVGIGDYKKEKAK